MDELGFLVLSTKNMIKSPNLLHIENINMKMTLEIGSPEADLEVRQTTA